MTNFIGTDIEITVEFIDHCPINTEFTVNFTTKYKDNIVCRTYDDIVNKYKYFFLQYKTHRMINVMPIVSENVSKNVYAQFIDKVETTFVNQINEISV